MSIEKKEAKPLMERKIKLFLVFCLIPAILFWIQAAFTLVPLRASLVLEGETIHLRFENWITALGLDYAVNVAFYWSILFQSSFAIVLLLQSRRKKLDSIHPIS